MKKAEATILIADDDSSLRNSLKVALQDDYHVLTAADGKEALAAIQKESIDLIILDIRMPVIEGMEILKEAKNDDPSIEVIMLTGMDEVSQAVEAMRLGAYDYITKPFDFDKLMGTIEKVVEHKMLRKEHAYL